MIVKVALVSQGAPSTMLALMSNASVLQVISGAVILLLPFSGLVVIYANEELYRNRLMPKWKRREIHTAVYAATFFLSFLMPWTWVATVCGIMTLRHFVYVRDKRKGRVVENIPVLAHEEWLQNPPADIRCYGIWQQIKEKEQEKQRIQANLNPDLSEIGRIHLEISDLSTQYNARVDEITRERHSQGKVISSVMYTYALILAVQFLGNDKPWLPAELVELKGGGREISYVVSSTEGWTTILRDDPRQIFRVRSDSVISRQICSTADRTEESTRTLWRLAAGSEPIYQKCPTPRQR
ncbi:hypothetical protein [Streptomyces sp. NPDC018000]|uniref:hypothetical protein n=1 Tax=Streptomyces sp. NPDC018000 TaxID=3365028 RepID=UPI0037AC59B3